MAKSIVVRAGMPDADACGGTPEIFDVSFTPSRRRRRGSDIDYVPTRYANPDFIDACGGGSDDSVDGFGGDATLTFPAFMG